MGENETPHCAQHPGPDPMSLLRQIIGAAGAAAASNVVHRKLNERAAVAAMPVIPAPVDASGMPVPLEVRRVFGLPGASLYASGLDPAAVEAGIAGENKVGAELASLAAGYPNTYVFHSVKLPGHLGDVDHLVIQGSAALLVDSKNWKHDANYHIFHHTREADFVSRNGEDFEGGEIHLWRQTGEWQQHFASSGLAVTAALVVSNRTSTVSESIGVPYTIANLDGLALVFANTFTTDPAGPMHPALLNHVLGLVQVREQAPAGAGPGIAPVPVEPAVRKPATALSGWLLAWAIVNFTLLLPVLPVAIVSIVPALITAHVHYVRGKRRGLGGRGLLTAVFILGYLELALWLLVMAVYGPMMISG